MPVDIYYTPQDELRAPALSDVQRRLSEAGIDYALEPDSDAPDMQWFVFEPRSATTICATVKDGGVVFATVQAAYDDDPEFAEMLDRVMADVGLVSEGQ
jgi:hypothetical protein